MVQRPDPGHMPPGTHPGHFGFPQQNNEKLTAAFISDMVVGQSGFVNNMNVNGLVPETYTLQFSYVAVEHDTSDQEFIPVCKAIIDWKIDGQQQRRVISVISGASISAPCNAIGVRLVDEPLGGDATIGKKYKVQATLSRGVRANTQEPPTLVTDLVEGINNASNFKFQVPKDAGVTSLFVYLASGSTADAPAETSVIAVFSDNHLPSPGVHGSFFPFKCCHWVPLPPGAQAVTIFNGSGAEVFARIIWGIDG
jgi:hypothetical protein